MSVSENDSGVVLEHIGLLEKACRELDLFLLIRPTDMASTRLIKQGYATKSMSVHDKSSNWGPMAGFVPCDQYFSKKYIGKPEPAPVYHEHGPAVPVHLRLADTLVTTNENLVNVTPQPPSAGTGVRFVNAKDATDTEAKKIVFKLVKQGKGWDVHWMHKDTPVKLFVWGYRVQNVPTPVTGDYDLWMVAPHMNWWKLQMQVLGVSDKHGTSAATLLNNHLLGRLNDACGRSDNPVFNHGAEAQNYGFTQAIDKRIAMFTPAGGSRMVDRGDLPQALADMQNAGYLVCWNKRYGEPDPMLSGSPLQVQGLSFPMSELDGMLKKYDKSGKHSVLGYLAKKGDTRLSDMLDIREFRTALTALNEQIKQQTDRQAPKFLRVGDTEDLPTEYAAKRGGDGTLAAQIALQQALVQSTKGAGETDLKSFEAWVDKNIGHIATLCEAYGEAPGSPGSSRGFLLERIPGTESYRRA